MVEIDNKDLLKISLRALCQVSGRRTSDNFAKKVITSIIESFKEKYNFLIYVKFKHDENFEDLKNFIIIDEKINSYSINEICKCIEQIIRIIYLDLKHKTGIYFIKEFRQYVGEKIISLLDENGVDIDLLEFEHQHIYNRENKKKSYSNDASLLGYSWRDVKTWRYDDHNDVCILYNKNGGELDKLNLSVIIKNHIEKLSSDDENDKHEDIEIKDNDIKLINLINNKDLYIDTVTNLLDISFEEITQIVDKLVKLEILHYTDLDVVSITEKGKKYLK